MQNDSNPSQGLQGIRILVVDDYEDARKLVATILEREGAEVVQAESVAEALQVMSAHSFGLLVSDIGMPIEDGYDLIRRVRSASAAGWAPELPALAVTAFSSAADREHALAAGYQEHLAKPVDMVTLVAAVTRLIAVPPAPRLE